MDLPIFVGIDISSDLVHCSTIDGYSNYTNNKKGYIEMYESLSITDSHWLGCDIVGHLSDSLKMFVYETGVRFTEIPGHKIKHFGIMEHDWNKDDKRDASHIREYMQHQFKNKGANGLPLWEPEPVHVTQARKLISIILLNTKIQLMKENSLEYTKHTGFPFVVTRVVKADVLNSKKRIAKMREQLIILAKNHYNYEYNLVRSVVSIGDLTAATIVLLYQGFNNFHNKDQVISFAGLDTTKRQSGTSIYGKNKISKRGNPWLRYLLFNCAFNAIVNNPHCKRKYDILRGRKVHYMKARIAVSKTLLKLAFGCVKSGAMYSKKFKYKRRV